MSKAPKIIGLGDIPRAHPHADKMEMVKASRAQLIELARTNGAAFNAMVLKDEMTGSPIRLAPMHRKWHRLVDRHPRLNIISHVEAAKSQTLSVGRVLFELGKNPNTRCVIVSNTMMQAQKLLKSIASYIERSDELHEIFPDLKPNPTGPWTLTQLAVERKGHPKDPSVQSTGVHGAITGARIDLLVLDDILDYENARTPAGREDLWDWVHSALFGRLTANARVISVGNAYHRDDFLHRIEKNPLWTTVRFPVMEHNGELSWPERWPIERITHKREELGPLEFARQMMCQARDDTESRFQKEWIDLCLMRGNGKNLVHAVAQPPPGCAIYTGVDLAVQQHSSADLTAFTTILVYPNGDREILNIESGRMAGPQILEKIKELYHRYQGIFFVENNACFVAGTKVLTKEGYKPIELVQVGDMVWTHQARWRPVTEVHQGYSKTLVEAKAQGVLPVKATPNHWFWLREAGRTPGRQGGHYRPVGDAQWVSYGFRDKDAYAAVALPKWDACEPVLKLPETANKRAYEVPVTEELALVLGLYMAEGHSTKGQVSFTLHEKEGYLAELIERVIPTVCAGSITRSNHQANTLRVTISNTQLAQALHIGTGPDKCLPLEWLGWPLALRLALVRGWLLGDGCALQNNKSTRWPVWMLNGQSCSRNWMLFVRATLNDAGITSALAPIAPKKGKIGKREIISNGGFKLSLSRDDSRKLRQHMTHATEAERWERWFKEDTREALHASNVRLVYEGGHGWSKVPTIEEQPYQEHNGVVFNLTVEEDHSYTVEEFIVHNAQDFILQFLKASTAIPVKPFTTGRNKVHPEFGIEGVAAEMAAGKWIIPNRDGKMHSEVEALVNEMLYYDPKAHSGDRLMSCWMAREAARKGTIKAEVGYLPTMRR